MCHRTHILEYSLVIASVVSIGHLSTTALAASTLGSMTASVTGYSIVQGFASTLDTLLPSAWTSSHPELVGLWSQRMGKSLKVMVSLMPNTVLQLWLWLPVLSSVLFLISLYLNTHVSISLS